MTATIDATFETANAAYTISLPAVAIVTGFGEHDVVAYRSAPIAIANPATDPFVDARFTINASNAATACSFHATATSDSERTSKDDRDAVETASAGAPSMPVFAHNLSPPACAKPFVPARVSGNPTQPGYPPITHIEGAIGLVVIRVDLATDGSIAKTSIYRSSHNRDFDNAALRAAGSSRYQSEQFRCDAVGGTYLFTAQFVPL